MMLKGESSCKDSDYIGVQRSDGSKDPSLRFSTYKELLVILSEAKKKIKHPLSYRDCLAKQIKVKIQQCELQSLK